ncbi:hypothetical protein KBTX_02796 [wastewater metagenome]|uniref:Uncharacterized protein n=2 Tax=unclassified sequences TaxID=12908 RepID=A0A5B8RF26_9ZZZZ|nr:hypothetical protein [Arhodomonas sp. KWT]QEA06458.1 hypothetical protein KBTEX_02796 [uncultured organism]
MPNLTYAQRLILLIYALAAVSLVLWPPFYYDMGDRLINAGHAFLLEPPAFRRQITAMVAYRTLAVYISGLTLAAGAAVLAAGNREKGDT